MSVKHVHIKLQISQVSRDKNTLWVGVMSFCYAGTWKSCLMISRWMENIAKKHDFDVTFTNISDDYMVLSVAGPKSRHVMDKLTDTPVTEEAWPFMTQQDVELAGVQVHAFRLSYTGGFIVQFEWRYSLVQHCSRLDVPVLT